MTCKNKCNNNFARLARNRVLIESQSLVDDGFGGQTNTWTTVGTYWAWVQPFNGNERYIQEHLQSTVTHKVIVRYQSALADTKITGSYRMTLDMRLHQIEHVMNLDENMKDYGIAYQRLLTNENAGEIDG